ncbi:hypothetical protein DYB32_004316 [Aphanomyces invadans]|uniref:GPI transamidase subunit PIG-U n=1 Tax=Aphanomyces invadans TaxID=157072 RepID=A0A418AY24_9STRA|nr:hypothetical protein DYB32_004316 [Aphanomyces invadans]
MPHTLMISKFAIMTSGKVAATVAAGAALRVGLFVTGLDAFTQDRLEYVTPLNSYQRLQEGHFLYKACNAPYAGDSFHQPPLVLALYNLLESFTAFNTSLRVCWIGCTIAVDVLIALGFASLCRFLVPAILLLSIATYLSVYPVVLSVPVLLLVHHARSSMSRPSISTSMYLPLPRVAFSLVLFASCLGGLTGLSYVFMGRSWSFVESTYVWLHRYPDLTPNIGIFWYFFMELFDRFQPYFLFLLHVHPYVYIAPLYIRLRYDNGPLFIAHPLDHRVARDRWCMNNKFVLATGLVVASVLMPVMGFLWLYPGSGNANFFYNQTIVFQFFYLRVVGQFLAATMRRDKQLDEYVKLH